MNEWKPHSLSKPAFLRSVTSVQGDLKQQVTPRTANNECVELE